MIEYFLCMFILYLPFTWDVCHVCMFRTRQKIQKKLYITAAVSRFLAHRVEISGPLKYLKGFFFRLPHEEHWPHDP